MSDFSCRLKELRLENKLTQKTTCGKNECISNRNSIMGKRKTRTRFLHFRAII